jgi:hypothetical protein
VEVAARNQLLRTRGRHAARDLAARLDEQIRNSAREAELDAGEDVEHGGPV